MLRGTRCWHRLGSCRGGGTGHWQAGNIAQVCRGSLALADRGSLVAIQSAARCRTVGEVNHGGFHVRGLHVVGLRFRGELVALRIVAEHDALINFALQGAQPLLRHAAEFIKKELGAGL